MMKSIKCPDCGGELRKFVDITIDCPIDQRALDKKAIRDKSVKIKAVYWKKAIIYCVDCYYTMQNDN